MYNQRQVDSKRVCMKKWGSTLPAFIFSALILGCLVNCSTWSGIASCEETAKSIGPFAGETPVTVIVHPGDSSKILVRTYTHGVLKSIDGGKTFQVSEGLPHYTGITKCPFAEDPARPDIIYSAGYTDGATGLYRSEDFGSSWSKLPFPGTEYIRNVAVNPTGQLVFVVTFSAVNSKVYRSTDQGNSWSPVFRGSVTAVAISESSPKRVYLGTSKGLYRSNDGGQSWTRIPWESKTFPQEIVVDPADPNHLYVAQFQQLLVSKDGGRTFSQIGRGLAPSYFCFMRFDPRDASHQSIWAGVADELFLTTDAGLNWSRVSRPFGSKGWSFLDLSFDRKRLMYLGVAEIGLFVSPLNSKPIWRQIGFPKDSIRQCAITRPRGKRVVVGDIGAFASDPGRRLRPTSFIWGFGGDSYALAVDPVDASRWLVGGRGTFIDNATIEVLTENGKKSRLAYGWKTGTGYVRSIAFKPTDPRIVLAGIGWPLTYPGAFPNSGGFVRSTDQGETWTPVPKTHGKSWIVQAVSWDPYRPSHVIALLNDNRWAESHDSGATWNRHSERWPGSGEGVEFAFDPFKSGTWYRADTGTGWWRSDNSGSTWVSLNIPANYLNHIRFDPKTAGRLWVSSGDSRVLESNDSGDHWATIFSVPEGKAALGLAYDPETQSIIVGTDGASAFEVNVAR